ncbi:MAG: protocatechuate 3,4-dioxygenase [Candidatus Rokuibacteriota bacterium]|nr:MAG: protocatechuate 3,4-dioxygenase [Candidatus Rokubacteria bacterium]
MMTDQMGITPRRVLQGSIALGGLTIAAPLAPALGAEEILKWGPGLTTPSTVAGPFYPLLSKPVDRDADLTVISGRKDRAKGPVVHVMGRVLNLKGDPVKGVQVEIWQANAAGRYDHPVDPNPAPLDPNFQGYGVVVTDAEGRYRFKTIKPGGYPLTQSSYRAPHIHFELTGRMDRHITQMWFPGELLNSQDQLFTVLSPRAQQKVTCKLEAPTGSMEPESQIALWDIVIPNG